MMRLKSEQQRLYMLMPQQIRCFVRVCAENSALWVSDLPRRYADPDSLAEQLSAEGFTAQLDEQAKLWYVDWTEKRWLEMLEPLPAECPPFPEDEAYHEAYALCRLLMSHPSGLESGQLPMIRRILKLTAQQPEKMLASIRSLQSEAAEGLRKEQKTAHAAGRVLAAWLNEHAYGKEIAP